MQNCRLGKNPRCMGSVLLARGGIGQVAERSYGAEVQGLDVTLGAGLFLGEEVADGAQPKAALDLGDVVLHVHHDCTSLRLQF